MSFITYPRGGPRPGGPVGGDLPLVGGDVLLRDGLLDGCPLERKKFSSSTDETELMDEIELMLLHSLEFPIESICLHINIM